MGRLAQVGAAGLNVYLAFEDARRSSNYADKNLRDDAIGMTIQIEGAGTEKAD